METIAFGGGDDEVGGDRGGVAMRASAPAGDGAADDRGKTRSGGGWKGEGRREEGRHRTVGTRRGDARTRDRTFPRSERRPRLPRRPRPRPRPRGALGSAPGSAPGSARVANPGSARVANPGSARVATLVATLASLGPVACRPPVDDGGGARGSTPVQTGPAARGVSHARRGVLRRRGRPSLGRLGRAREGRRGSF